MGLVNQGWFVRCDECEEADRGYIGARTRNKAIADARRDGWFKRRGKWFCSSGCLDAWRATDLLRAEASQ